MMPAAKTCPACRIEKPASSFWKNCREHDGLQRYCRACLTEFQRESAARSAARYAERFAQAATFCLCIVGLQLVAMAVQP